MTTRHAQLISQFAGLKVLVVGEMILDTYLVGTTSRLCREAPVPTVNVIREDLAPGGAANTAVNLAALGAQVTFLSAAGDDAEARAALARLQPLGVDTRHVQLPPGRQTLVKRRVLADAQLLVRLDAGSTEPITAAAEGRLVNALRQWFTHCDAVVVSDYGYGVLTPALVAALSREQQAAPRTVVVDSKDLTRYRSAGVTAVKPNYSEALQLLGLPRAAAAERSGQILAHGQRMLAVTNARLAAVTIDQQGSVIFEQGQRPYRTYTRPVENARAAGAGDTYIAALALALAAGAATVDAAELAQAAAEVVVHKNGTAACSQDELAACFAPPSKVVLDRAELAARCAAYREQGRRIVFTNGCFDILHTGHTSYLAQAKALGDILVVGVNTDASVQRLKGPERPINSLADRMAVLAALSSVDHVIRFDEDTPIELLRAVQPHLFVKGGDYALEDLPEAPVVAALGGEVRLLPYVSDHSTTHLIERIQAVQAGGGGQPAPVSHG